MPHNPDWTREELIIAADLLMRNEWSTQLSVTDPRVIEVSELLRRADYNAGKWKDDAYRNANSVRRKYSDLYTKNPSYQGKPTRGGDLTEQVLKEFLAHPKRMALEAARIRADIIAGTQRPVTFQHSSSVEPGRSGGNAEIISVTPRGGAGFGTAEHNKRVEDASMAAVTAYYGELNCRNVSGDKVGWDITVTRDAEVLKVEVKGVSGPDPIVLLTRNEYRAAQTEAGWVLAVVTRALTDRPQLQSYSARDALAAAEPFVHRLILPDVL